MSKNSPSPAAPLADRMRPLTLAEFVGQKKIIGSGTMLRRLVEQGELMSLIFWGPPGVGKTTLAHIIAQEIGADFRIISAVSGGKEELRTIAKEAKEHLQQDKQKTVLFIDEIHRWNKAQQDALLPYVEQGVVILIGATTENPSFEIIGALLSRSQVFVLERLTDEDVEKILRHALEDSGRGLGGLSITVPAPVITLAARLAGGDARSALNALDVAVRSRAGGEKIELVESDIVEAFQRVHVIFDKNGEEFYNIISALHKSMRGSDADAALYWLARMLEGGVDPLYVARRVVRFASEDVGMANSEALIQANAAYDACHKLGMPECAVHLAQAVVYCAKSVKSNALYTAYGAAAKDAKNTSHLGVPLHLRNAPTKFMKNIGYGKGYKYNPEYSGPVDQDYLPPPLKGKKYLPPSTKK